MTTDPVADKSGFLRMYMSNHPDTLVAYAKWYGKVTDTIVGAEMTAIDSKSMTLTCTLKSGEKKPVRVAIEPPLSGYDDVKPRLLEMKAKAQEGLGMIKAPQINYFQLTSKVTSTLVLILALCYCTYGFFTTNPSTLFTPGRSIVAAIGGTFTLKCIWVFMVVAHSLESIYTYTLCRRHKTGFFVGAGYVISTILFGYPVWIDLRKKIQAARIDSVMKVQ